MPFKTITAKFAGTCVRCRKAGINDGRQAIQVGSSIRYGGRGQTYHLSKACPASQEREEPVVLANFVPVQEPVGVGAECGDASDCGEPFQYREPQPGNADW